MSKGKWKVRKKRLDTTNRKNNVATKVNDFIHKTLKSESIKQKKTISKLVNEILEREYE